MRPDQAAGGRAKVGSLFSGVEGIGQGLEAAGFEVVWQVEIDRDAVSVLERHYPNVRRYRDVREVRGSELEPVDVLVGGFPCQDLSVAGARKGLAGERSGLFFEVARIAAETATPWLLLENVDGLLSQWTPVEAPPSGVEIGTEWEVEESPDLGLVLATLQEHGYLGCLRVLDAQYFGIPQRRERVFLVGHLGATGARALDVLLEPESVLRDLAACLQERQGAPGVPASGAGSGGVADVAFTLRHNTNGTGSSDNAWNTTYVPVSGTLTGELSHGATAQSAANGLLVPVSGQGVRDALTAHGGSRGRIDAESETFVVAAPLTAGGHPNSNMPGRHREDDHNLVVANTLRSGHHGYDAPRGDGADNLVATFDERNVTSAAIRSRCEPGLPAGTLHVEPQSVVAFNWQAGGGGNDDSFRGKSRQYVERAGDYAGALSATRVDAIHSNASVRRLMPIECERLMGFTDDWTRWRADGSEIKDGPRYRLCGNAVVTAVTAWIGKRLRAALEAS